MDALGLLTTDHNRAPTAADKEHLSTKELEELAKEQEIPGRSSMSREELVATVDRA